MNVMERINQRRRQMIVHPFLYYRLGTSIIDDKTFDRWAYELRDLQREHPSIASECIYADDFKTWDGTTGYDLPTYEPWVQAVAERLLRQKGGRQ